MYKTKMRLVKYRINYKLKTLHPARYVVSVALFGTTGQHGQTHQLDCLLYSQCSVRLCTFCKYSPNSSPLFLLYFCSECLKLYRFDLEQLSWQIELVENGLVVFPSGRLAQQQRTVSFCSFGFRNMWCTLLRRHCRCKVFVKCFHVAIR